MKYQGKTQIRMCGTHKVPIIKLIDKHEISPK